MRYTKIRTSHPIVLVLSVAALIIGTTAFPPSSGLVFAQSAGPIWAYTGSLNTGRYGHTATHLPDGVVLHTLPGADKYYSSSLWVAPLCMIPMTVPNGTTVSTGAGGLETAATKLNYRNQRTVGLVLS